MDKYMGVSFQEYSWIQDFEADFPYRWKVSLKILNLADCISFTDLLSVYLKHLKGSRNEFDTYCP